MHAVVLSLALLGSTAEGPWVPPCRPLEGGVSRPLPYPVSKEPGVYRLVAHAQDRTAVVYLDPRDAAEPAMVQVELFFRGKKEAERTLLLRGRLSSPVAVRKAGGSEQVRFGVLGAAVSPDGVYVALLSGLKILVFREEDFLGAVDADFLPSVALTDESLFWSPWAHRKGDPLLMRWSLTGGESPEQVLAHDREKGAGRKLLAARGDGQLWVVDAFTGEPWLLGRDGRVKRRGLPLRLAASGAKEATESRRVLEAQLPPEALDATKRPPSVELYPVDRDPLITQVYALGNDVVVATGAEPQKLFWFSEDNASWRCLQLPTDLGADATDLVVGREGLWVKGKGGPLFYPAERLQEKAGGSGDAGRESLGPRR